jgi:hypothetical protein
MDFFKYIHSFSLRDLLTSTGKPDERLSDVEVIQNAI